MPGQEANGINLGKTFRSSNTSMLSVLIRIASMQF